MFHFEHIEDQEVFFFKYGGSGLNSVDLSSFVFLEFENSFIDNRLYKKENADVSLFYLHPACLPATESVSG